MILSVINNYSISKEEMEYVNLLVSKYPSWCKGIKRHYKIIESNYKYGNQSHTKFIKKII